MQNFINIMSALSDPNRLRLLMSLSGRELCVCQLVQFMGLADSTVSKHMSILRDAGLVAARKRGRWVYYRQASENTTDLARQIIQLAQQHMLNDRIIAADAARIAEIIRNGGDKICQPESVAAVPMNAEPSCETA